jgi:thioesterase domain-containing protein/acyl carrier protein
MVPWAFVMLESLPLTANGKLDRRALPPWSGPARSQDQQFVRPRTRLEHQLAQIWEQILGVQPVSVLDSFFDLGGNSLLAVRLVSEINNTLHCDLRILTLFQQPTIEQLAKILPLGSPGKDIPAVFSLRSGGTGLPLFFVAAAGPWQFNLAGRLGDRHPIFAIDSLFSPQVLRAAAAGDDASLPKIEEIAAHQAALIRSRVRSGPCLLAGYCFGGVVAFEVAHQLERVGIDVEVVFLFETRLRAPMPRLRFKFWSRKHARNTLEQGLGYLWRKTWTRLHWVRRKLRASLPKSPPPPDASLAADEASLQVWPNYERLMQHAFKIYRPRRLTSRGVLFLSSVGKEKFYDEFGGTVGTAQLFSGGLKILEVPGDHSSMFQEPHVRTLAQQLNGCLEQLHPD